MIPVLATQADLIDYMKKHQWCLLCQNDTTQWYITPVGILLAIDVIEDKIARLKTVDHVTM